MLLHGSTATLPPTLTQESDSTLSGSKRVSYNSAERLSSITGITRSMISGVVSQVHGPWLLHLGSRERIFILENVAAIYSILGYLRKEAYILREVLGCIMDLVVCGREEGGGTMIAGAGLGIQGVDLGDSTNRGSVGIRTAENTVGNESVLRVVKHVCRVHGIDLEAVRLVVDETVESEEVASADLEDTETAEGAYGWPELQIGIVREAIAVAEALPGWYTPTNVRVRSSKVCRASRLPGRCAVLLVFSEDTARRHEPRRPASLSYHRCTGPVHCKTKRRFSSGRLLVWKAYCQR